VVNVKKRKRVKALEANVKTICNSIKIKRLTKNLTPGHVARRMGIAATVIYSWEDGTATPNDWQMELLAKMLGCEVKDFILLPTP
jgi:DNA-binding transcriptional regulator YiaG